MASITGFWAAVSWLAVTVPWRSETIEVKRIEPMIAAPSAEPTWRKVLVTPEPSPASSTGTEERGDC